MKLFAQRHVTELAELFLDLNDLRTLEKPSPHRRETSTCILSIFYKLIRPRIESPPDRYTLFRFVLCLFFSSQHSVDLELCDLIPKTIDVCGFGKARLYMFHGVRLIYGLSRHCPGRAAKTCLSFCGPLRHASVSVGR